MTDTPRFEIRRSRIGRHRWRVVLIGDNGEVLSVSEHLNSRQAALTNIAATVSDARHATIVDTSKVSST